MEEQEFDCEYTDQIICPHCGYKERDSWEYEFKNERMSIWCNECDKKITVYQHIKVDYSTYKGWED